MGCEVTGTRHNWGTLAWGTRLVRGPEKPLVGQIKTRARGSPYSIHPLRTYVRSYERGELPAGSLRTEQASLGDQ